MSAPFTLDTSGAVEYGKIDPATGLETSYVMTWDRLSPFAQGYVEAMLRDVRARVHGETLAGARARIHYPMSFPGFSDLAPETLALILRDCEARRASDSCVENTREGGRSFWKRRQAGDRPAFPPLTPYLGDDGKIYLREDGR